MESYLDIDVAFLLAHFKNFQVASESTFCLPNFELFIASRRFHSKGLEVAL